MKIEAWVRLFWIPLWMFKKSGQQLTECNLRKLQSVCTTKETINQLKRQSTEWEKIFTSYMPDRVLISRVYKEIQKLTLIK